MRSAHSRIGLADILSWPVALHLFILFMSVNTLLASVNWMEMETFISASEIPLVVSAIGVNLTGKFRTDSGKMVIKLV